MDSCQSDDKRVKISYDLKILQRITDDADYVVTLNADGAVDPSKVLAEMNYAHPTYTREVGGGATRTVDPERRPHARLPGRGRAGASTRTVVPPACGLPSRSGSVGEHGLFDRAPAIETPWSDFSRDFRRNYAAAQTPPNSARAPEPRIYFASTAHRRNSNAPGAVTRTFSYTTCYWLVDVDDLPVLPRPLRPFTRFEARDHLGDPDGGLADNARAVLAENGLQADRILLLTCPRVVGHVFNPLSVFYCFAARADQLAANGTGGTEVNELSRAVDGAPPGPPRAGGLIRAGTGVGG